MRLPLIAGDHVRWEEVDEGGARRRRIPRPSDPTTPFRKSVRFHKALLNKLVLIPRTGVICSCSTNRVRKYAIWNQHSVGTFSSVKPAPIHRVHGLLSFNVPSTRFHFWPYRVRIHKSSYPRPSLDGEPVSWPTRSPPHRARVHHRDPYSHRK